MPRNRSLPPRNPPNRLLLAQASTPVPTGPGRTVDRRLGSHDRGQAEKDISVLFTSYPCSLRSEDTGAPPY